MEPVDIDYLIKDFHYIIFSRYIDRPDRSGNEMRAFHIKRLSHDLPERSHVLSGMVLHAVFCRSEIETFT